MPAPPLQLPTTALGAARMSRAKFAHSPSSLKPHDVTGWRVATQTPRADDPFGVRPGIRTLEPRTLEPRTLKPSNAVASAGAMLSIPPHNTTMGHMGMITPSLPLPPSAYARRALLSSAQRPPAGVSSEAGICDESRRAGEQKYSNRQSSHSLFSIRLCLSSLCIIAWLSAHILIPVAAC